ncbi:unnamed protein product [Brachionus calyciflorus]|uniref:Uncharacterized protein n=1 Tax=Brachionus calyciflorus TaxID=104777 RepID=A0A814G1Y6_9BILA|nr:unnamed protein product [Brachionus calyciflorus]
MSSTNIIPPPSVVRMTSMDISDHQTNLFLDDERSNNKRVLSTNTTPEKNVNKRTKIHNSVAPIIFFRINEKYFKNSNLLVRDFLSYFEPNEIKVELKITLNGNLIVFPESQESKELIIKRIEIFPECKRLDLSSQEKQRPMLLIKNSCASDISIHEQELAANGIEEKKLLEDRILVINSVRYQVGEIARPPKRCKKCKKFYHTALNCTNEACCGRCGRKDHDDENCPSIKTKEFNCVNCGENHSSYYEGCRDSDNKQITSTGFYRSYSDVANSKNSNNEILEKLNEIQNNLNSKIEKIETKINNIKLETVEEINQIIQTKITEFTRQFILNNSRVLHFTLDMLKILFPNMKKPNKNQIQLLISSYKHHELGNGIDSSALTAYCESLFRS